MSIEIKLREIPNCRCMNTSWFTVLMHPDEQALLHKLQAGDHPRMFDGRCEQCGGPVDLACTVTVKDDGRKVMR